MEERTFKIVLDSGTIYKNLQRNGSFFISKEKIDINEISQSPQNVVVKDEDGAIVDIFSYATITEVFIDEEGLLWFSVIDRTWEDIFRDKFDSKLDYLSLMTGIDLENEIEKVRTISNEGGGTARNTQLLCDISELVFGTKKRCELLSTKAGSPCSNSRPLQGRDTNFLLLSGTLFEIQKGGVAA